MLEILEDLTHGRGRPAQLPLLEDLAWTIQRASLCALGKSAPNPVLSTLRYFREEYEAHVEGRCPAGACKALVGYAIRTEDCAECGLCEEACPHGAIRHTDVYAIDQALCNRCGICLDTCATGAIHRVAAGQDLHRQGAKSAKI
jgi:ferredoxin